MDGYETHSTQSIGALLLRREEEGQIVLWTVYNGPRDFPDKIVARRFIGERPTPNVIGGELEDLRDLFRRAGYIHLHRQPEDDPVIIETWI